MGWTSPNLQRAMNSASEPPSALPLSQAQPSHPSSYLQLVLLSCLEHWQVVGPASLLGFQVLLPESLPEH